MNRGPRRRRRSGKSRVACFEQLEDRRLFDGDPLWDSQWYQTAGEPLVAPVATAAVSNQPITLNSDVQQMPSVAVDPLDSNHVVIAYMDYSLVDTGYAGIGVAVSKDGGSTWQHSTVPLPAGFEQGAANPIVKFDTVDHDLNQAGVQNRIYVSFMAANVFWKKTTDHQPRRHQPRYSRGIQHLRLHLYQRHFRGPQRRRRHHLEHPHFSCNASVRWSDAGPVRPHARSGDRYQRVVAQLPQSLRGLGALLPDRTVSRRA